VHARRNTSVTRNRYLVIAVKREREREPGIHARSIIDIGRATPRPRSLKDAFAINTWHCRHLVNGADADNATLRRSIEELRARTARFQTYCKINTQLMSLNCRSSK